MADDAMPERVSPPAVAEVAACRAELADSGYTPIEVINHDTDHPSAGKAPFRAGWQHGGPLGPVDRRALNTGILCTGLRAIDIDIDDPTAAQRVKALAIIRFGEAPMRCRDNSPRVLLLYRAAAGQPGKRMIAGTVGKVEVLGRGQQFVAYGTHHSGARLQWQPEGPTTWAADALPVATEEAVSAFLVEVAPIIGDVSRTTDDDPTRRQPSRFGQTASVLDVVSALAAIPNDGPVDWEGWNRIGMALWGATAGSEMGREAFHEWSARHPLYDQHATDGRWDHYRTSPPGAGAGTLFRLARDHGWNRSPQLDEKTPSHPALSVINPVGLATTAPPPREWIVDRWLPVGVVTLNYGDGGTGKTLLTQQLMTSCATGGPWIGLDVLRCRSIGLFCEDDEAELHRRQLAICDAYGLQLRDLADMRWASGSGQDNLLVTFSHDGRVQPTQRFSDLLTAAQDHKARLIVVDTAADTFGGNENDRQQVRQYVGHVLGKLAKELNAAVLVNAHPSRTGLASGDLDGGSTGWSNSARSRWSLARPKGEEGASDTPQRVLTRRKSNYASIGEEIRLRWQDGAFVAEGAARGNGDTFRQAYVDGQFLTLLDRCTTASMWLSHSKNATNYAPKTFAARPDRAGVTSAEFAAALVRLLADGRLVLESYGRSGDARQRLARGTGVQGGA